MDINGIERRDELLSKLAGVIGDFFSLFPLTNGVERYYQLFTFLASSAITIEGNRGADLLAVRRGYLKFLESRTTEEILFAFDHDINNNCQSQRDN